MLRSVAAVTVAAAVALLVVSASLGGASAPALRGSVGPGFTIKLTKSGRLVKRLVPGTYRITVSDRSAQHNFVLERERGNERVLTSVPFVGTKTVTVRLTRGVWKFYCEPHESLMFGRFAVGAAAISSPRSSVTTTNADDHGGHGEPEAGDDHGGR